MRLLLAEDELALSKALTAILERNNYSVDAAYDGQAALEYLEADNYDGVILDVMMPKADGITVLKEIRKRGNLIPVLLLTAKSEVDDKVLGLDAGANDYLTKPFHSRELLARIRAHDPHTDRPGKLAAANGKCHAGPGYLRALHPIRDLPTGKQGISDDGAFDEQPQKSDLFRAVHGENLGI